MKINEIFVALSGESERSGLRTVFVRTYGCIAPFCTYCDTRYAIEGNEFTEMSVYEIVAKVKEYDCPRVLITGGEPLLQKETFDLVIRFLEENLDVEIETNGAIDIRPYIKDITDLNKNLLITMDWKCPSSGMNHLMLKDNLNLLRCCDVIKFVVGSEEDLSEMIKISRLTTAQVYVSPVFGMIEPKVIAEYIRDNNLNDVKMQIQMHKVIYPADARGV